MKDGKLGKLIKKEKRGKHRTEKEDEGEENERIEEWQEWSKVNERRKSGWRDGAWVEPGGGVDGKAGEAGEQRQR